MTLQALKEEVQKLSKLERILFVQFVLDTISQEEEENQLSEEWVEELEARRKAYLKGEAKSFTWDEVKKQLPNASS